MATVEEKKAPFSLKKEFGTDNKLEEEGVWIELDGHGARIKVARAGNRNFKKAFTALSPQVRRQLERGTLPENQAAEITSRLMAEHILLDWEGLAENDEPLPYSKDAARRMLFTYPVFRSRVFEESQTTEYYRRREKEEDLKN